MKKIIILLFYIFISSFFGCRYTCQDIKDNEILFSAKFNEEHYVWENWLFNTNSTSKTLR